MREVEFRNLNFSFMLLMYNKGKGYESLVYAYSW